MGYGYQEKYYQRAVAIELVRAGIRYTREMEGPLNYGEELIGKYFLDFVVENKVVLEIKISRFFNQQDIHQIMSYLKSSNLPLGILVLFTKEGVKYKRILNNVNS